MYYPTTLSQNVLRCLIRRTDVDNVLGKEPTTLSLEGDPIGGSSLLPCLLNVCSKVLVPDGEVIILGAV